MPRPPDIDRGAAHRAGRNGRGARGGDATRFVDGLAFLRRFLARPHEVASTVWTASVLAAAGVPVQPLTADALFAQLRPHGRLLSEPP